MLLRASCCSVIVIHSFLLVRGELWPKGVVHYAINQKDYDAHSRDVIATTFALLEREVCLKFFNAPAQYNATNGEKILYISNKDQRKDCPPDRYDYGGKVVDVTIGYKCLNQQEIARIIADVLRASVELNVKPSNSFDLERKLREKDQETPRVTLLSAADRAYLNSHYAHECENLNGHPGLLPSYRRGARRGARREDDEEPAEDDFLHMSEENKQFYKNKVWPYGVIVFGVDNDLRNDSSYRILKLAMTVVELASCVVFQEINSQDKVLTPSNLLWFAKEGSDAPVLGFQSGNQTIDLRAATIGNPGYTAYPVMNLMRALGMPMASNRPDRDNYLTVHWENVIKGKEHFLEKYPEAAWLKQLPYDFSSVTHAAANFVCTDVCNLGETTVQPVQDHLWQRTRTMGHVKQLSNTDELYLKAIYAEQCQLRSSMPYNDRDGLADHEAADDVGDDNNGVDDMANNHNGDDDPAVGDDGDDNPGVDDDGGDDPGVDDHGGDAGDENGDDDHGDEDHKDGGNDKHEPEGGDLGEDDHEDGAGDGNDDGDDARLKEEPETTDAAHRPAKGLTGPYHRPANWGEDPTHRPAKGVKGSYHRPALWEEHSVERPADWHEGPAHRPAKGLKGPYQRPADWKLSDENGEGEADPSVEEATKNSNGAGDLDASSSKEKLYVGRKKGGKNKAVKKRKSVKKANA